MAGSAYIRPVTSEDLSRWQGQYKSKVLLVIGEGKVGVIVTSELVDEFKTTLSEIILIAQQQGYVVLGWEQYQKLLDEIGKLIGEDKEPLPGTIVETTADSAQEVKVLPKNSPL